MARRLPLLALVAGLAALAPAAPAAARCEDGNPCGTACHKAEAKYDEVTRKFGIPLPPFPVDCPQT